MNRFTYLLHFNQTIMGKHIFEKTHLYCMYIGSIERTQNVINWKWLTLYLLNAFRETRNHRKNIKINTFQQADEHLRFQRTNTTERSKKTGFLIFHQQNNSLYSHSPFHFFIAVTDTTLTPLTLTIV